MFTKFTERFGVTVPIVQGGLAHLAYAELAAAVSNAGGLGQITAATQRDTSALREEIRRAKRLTSEPFAINFAGGHVALEPLLDAAMEEGVAAISVTGTNPAPLFARIEGTGVRKLALTANLRQAQKAEAAGADAVIVVGYEGGGHLGRDDVATQVLLRSVVGKVGVPVLASGGIADGRQLLAMLALGADGIEMGTRFIATRECVAHDRYKELVRASQPHETVIIDRPAGRPGRALITGGAQRILDAESRGEELEDYQPGRRGAFNRRAAHEGVLEEGFVWGSQAAGLIGDVPSVAELFERMLDDAAAAFTDCARALGRTSDA